MCNKTRYLAVLAATGFAYFVLFPEDLPAVVMPITAILNLTNAVSPWLYGVAAVGIASQAVVKTCNRPAKS